MEAGCGLYERNPAENWLRVPICHLSDFALVAAPVGGWRLYLPLVMRNSMGANALPAETPVVWGAGNK